MALATGQMDRFCKANRIFLFPVAVSFNVLRNQCIKYEIIRLLALPRIECSVRMDWLSHMYHSFVESELLLSESFATETVGNNLVCSCESPTPDFIM